MADDNNATTKKAESNDERDQDEGGMNNGTIGGDMGIIGSSNEQDEANYSRDRHDAGSNTVRGDTGYGASNGSKPGTGLDLDSDPAGGQGEGSAAENI